MANIEIYTKDWCPYCARAKALLDTRQLDYEEIDVTRDAVREQEMIERSGRRTVPQVFIDGLAIGGYDDLVLLAQAGGLSLLLNAPLELRVAL